MSGPRRLIAVSHSGEVSGAEIVLLRVIQECLERAMDVVVVCPHGPLVDALPDGVRHVLVPPLGLGDGPRPVAAAGALRRSADASRTLRALVAPGDVVVANGLLALPAVAMARLAEPVAWIVHDVIVRRDWFALLRLVSGSVDRVVAVSEAAAAPLRERGLSVTVVPHGVAWPVAPRTQEPDPPVVGCAALLTPWKGHRVLLDAFALLDAPGVRLALAGGSFPKDAGYVAELRERADRPDLAGRVDFLGRVDPLPTMRGWTVAVSASTDPEAGPLVVLEAMSVGVPVVATDIGGSRELLADGAGVLVPPGSAGALAVALAELLDDPAARADLSARGLSVVAARHRMALQVPLLVDALLSTP